MKTALVLLFLLSSSIVNAQSKVQTNCLDSNFNGIETGAPYSELQYLNRFQLLYSGASPAPAGFEALHNGEHICFATTATYLQHNPSKKVYVVFTTGDDYCDGGNTMGVIVDLDKYADQQLESSVVAHVADGEVFCRK